MTVYYKGTSVPSAAPVYVPGVSVGLLAGNSSTNYQQNINIMNNTTDYRPNTHYNVGDTVGAWRFHGFKAGMLTIQADGASVKSNDTSYVNFTDSNNSDNFYCYIPAQAGVTSPAQYYFRVVDHSLAVGYLSLTQSGIPITSLGTPGAVIDAAIAPTFNGIDGLYVCSIAGTTGNGSTSPISTTIGAHETDGGVQWTALGLRSTPLALIYTRGAVMTTGKSGVGVAARVPYGGKVVTATDFVIGASSNLLSSVTAIPQPVGYGYAVQLTGGVNVTPGTYYVGTMNSVGQYSMFSNQQLSVAANMGTPGATGGIGRIYIIQPGGDIGFRYTPTRPSATATACFSVPIRLTTDVIANYIAAPWDIKGIRMLYTGSGQAPQSGCTVPLSWTLAPPPYPPSGHGAAIISYLPAGFQDFNGQNNANLTGMVVDGTDLSKFTLSAGSGTIYAGCYYTISSGTNFNVGTTIFLRYASTANINPATCAYRAYDSATGLTPVNIATVGGASGGAATFSIPAYPLARDGGVSPFGSSYTDIMDGNWHTLSGRYRAHSSPTVLDGTCEVYFDGVLVQWIALAAVGVIPAGGTKQWCGMAMVCNHPIGNGIAGPDTLELSGVQTNPSPDTNTTTYDMNLGAAGSFTDLDTARLWYEL